LHIFNGIIWPDFTRLPDALNPVLQFSPITTGQVLALCGHHIEVLPASHTVPAVGYAVLGATGAWAFTGDTGPNPALWQRLEQLPLITLVIETAFRDDEHALADVSRHLCPSQLGAELAQLATPTQVYITHIKPGEVDAVMAEVRALATRHHLHALHTGQVMVLA
jgi:ribonuclease BN (tRNA processing enzyme)